MTRIKGPYYSTRELEDVLNGIEPYDLATPQTQEWAMHIIRQKAIEIAKIRSPQARMNAIYKAPAPLRKKLEDCVDNIINNH
jgi:hypothetical protein